MKNPFPFFRSPAAKGMIPQEKEAMPEPQPLKNDLSQEQRKLPEDSFTEWRRSQVRGGIERRERTDMFEAYSVYGTDNGQLVCRYYHRYPEYERAFSLSYTRILSFDEFNRRLLAELDRSSLSPSDYHSCIHKAEELTGCAVDSGADYEGFTDEEAAALREFCEKLDTLTDKEFNSGAGLFHCSCRSVVGEDALTLRFRKPLSHDALYTETAGINRQPIEGYDIESLWIMGIYNRLRDQSASCKVTALTSQWSLRQEEVLLMTVQGFPAVEGTLLLAVSDSGVLSRFGFYSLDFTGK